MQAISELVSTRFIRHECLHLVCIICRYSAWFDSLCTHSASEELVECCWVAARSDSPKGVKLEGFVYKCANINLKLIFMEWWVMFFRCYLFFFFCDWTPQVWGLRFHGNILDSSVCFCCFKQEDGFLVVQLRWKLWVGTGVFLS